jgi:hypothetical protein
MIVDLGSERIFSSEPWGITKKGWKVLIGGYTMAAGNVAKYAWRVSRENPSNSDRTSISGGHFYAIGVPDGGEVNAPNFL